MTKKKGSDEEPFRELRRRAEAKSRGNCAADATAQKDPIALVHELSVHRIELEMQNEELRRAQQEAHEHYERFQDLYDFAPVSYLTLDVEGKIVGANLTAAAYFGIDRQTLVTMLFPNFLLHPSRREFLAFIKEVAASATRQRFEAQLRIKERSPGHAIIEGVAAPPGERAGVEVRIALTDITGLRRAEEALRKLNSELETKVTERTAELREKDRMLLLQSRQAAMGEMIGNISHQWRQPLNAIGLTVQSLLFINDAKGLEKEVLEATVKSAMEIINYMSGTIDDFRNFFKPDREKIPFHLESAVMRSLGLIGASLKDRGIAVDTVKNADPLVTGFLNEFSQAIINILLNARDAFEERKVDEPRVVIGISEENGRGVVTITDNAGGIGAEIIDKVFDPYFTTKSPDKGTGVGLFMAKSIIEKNMGGRLTVRNTGTGAEFRIELRE